MYIAQAEIEMDNLPVQKALLLTHTEEDYPDFAKEYATSELVDIRGSTPSSLCTCNSGHGRPYSTEVNATVSDYLPL